MAPTGRILDTMRHVLASLAFVVLAGCGTSAQFNTPVDASALDTGSMADVAGDAAATDVQVDTGADAGTVDAGTDVAVDVGIDVPLVDVPTGDNGEPWDGPCSGTVCGATCIDLQANNQNCGACGHVCDAGTNCARATCDPSS